MAHSGSIHLIAGHSNRPGWIIFTNIIDHGVQTIETVITITLDITHFVPDTPYKDRGMITITDNKIFNIISDIYLGSLLSSYFEFNIEQTVKLFNPENILSFAIRNIPVITALFK